MRVEVVRMSEKKRWKLIRSIGYAIPVLLVVYVLSVGPFVAFLMDDFSGTLTYEDRDLIQTFYAPLAWAAERNVIVGEIFEFYVRTWSLVL